MRHRSVVVGWLLLGIALLVASGAARAAGIDCSRARLPTEKAICASPALLSLDRSIADAYDAKLAQQPEQRDQARQELLAWLKRRDSVCNVAAAAIGQCLSAQMTARLAALAPPVAALVPPAAPPGAPAPPLPQVAAAPPVHEPAIPAGSNPAPPAAALDSATVPASEQAATLLHVTSPGRFTIAAKSPSGAALQLVDMLAGPGEVAGAAGTQDGRLDPLLDVGTYKLRATSAKAATGSVALTVTPFVDAAPPRALPAPGVPFDAELRDGQQRAFWLLVPASGAVRIEAAGRALADLRLWRDGRDLVALDPDARLVEPVPGHGLNDLRLVGKVEPGTYLVVAYGGETLRWTDNDTSQPLHLRAGGAGALAEGWAYGTIGPFGSEVFTLPASAQRVRLDVPSPEAVTLAAGTASVALARNSREASATLFVPAARPEVVEVSGKFGQPYKLQALAIPSTMSVSRPGSYFVTAVTAGAGADEVPPSVLLERTELRTAAGPQPPRVVASVMPTLSAGAGWRGQFNLRGPTTLLFQNATGGPVAARAAGVATNTGRGRASELPADVYALDLVPAPGTQGVVDLVVGAPGVNPAPTPPLPANPVLPLGLQDIAPGQSLQLSAFTAPGVSVGLSARRTPVALAEGALSATMVAGSTLSVPVQVAAGGTLAVSEGGGGPVPYTMQGNAVVVAAADRARTVVLAWRRAEPQRPDVPPPPPLASLAGLQAGRPAVLDLRADQQRGFSLVVPEGGLFRVETTGRLHTKGRLATPFIPVLGAGDGNGAGQNMLMQSLLRAGRYRVDVTALESSGHLGLTATPAPLLTGATLLPGGSVRATLPGGTGVRFPMEVGNQAGSKAGSEDGRYRLDVAGLGAAWTGRVDDAEGWPITAPGPLDGTELPLRPGRYSVLVIPDDVSRQVVARLSPIVAAPEISGHGPHPLAFDAPAQSVWREPDGRDQPRTPDTWTFGLEGPADVTLTLGDGMTGELKREGAADPVARVTNRFTGPLEAGHYRLETTSLGRNDRLAYTVALASPALQPDVVRHMAVPVSVPFAIAQARVVSLTTFGTIPLKGVLRRADGSTVARLGPRADDWTVAASRPLPAGRYTLDLAAASPPDTTAASSLAAPIDRSDDDPDSNNGDDQTAQTSATQTAATKPATAAATTPDAAPDADQPEHGASGDEAAAPSTVELRLALPEALPAAAAPAALAALPGRGVHVLTVPQPAPGSLVVAQARSSATVVLSLERQDGEAWRVVALDQGLAPLVGSPADAEGAAWRVQAWTVDGGPEPIEAAARAYDLAAQAPGLVTLAGLDGAPDRGLAVARVQLPAAGIAGLEGTPPGLLAGGWPGHALTAAEGNTVLPQGDEIWLLGRAPGSLTVTAQAMAAGQTIALALPAGLTATLPRSEPAVGHVALWRAASGLGLPGLGAAMGVAAGDTLAMADQALPLRNAAGEDALRLRLTRLEPALSPARTLAGALQTTLSPGTALPLVLPGGDKLVRADLAPGIAAVAGWRNPGASVVWTGTAPVSRTLSGTWTEVLLVNGGDLPAPASLSWQPAPAAEALRPGSIVKRFFGADGSFETTAEPAPGAHLMTAGNATLTVVTPDGRIMTGRDVALPSAGPARVIVETKAGAMAVWEAADGASPWPAVAAQPSALPARLALSGPAMAVALAPDGPVLLHARTTAPVLVGLAQAGHEAVPELFAAGAEFHRMLAGAAELRLYSPHDGPLSGTLELSADPVTPATEGLGPEVSLAPGGTAVFGFSLSKAATVGVGIRAVPDQVSVRLLDAAGTALGEGIAQLRALPAGRYAIEARVPPGAPTTTLRPAVVGITPRGNGPPPDVAQGYLELVGMKPTRTAP